MKMSFNIMQSIERFLYAITKLIYSTQALRLLYCSHGHKKVKKYYFLQLLFMVMFFKIHNAETFKLYWNMLSKALETGNCQMETGKLVCHDETLNNTCVLKTKLALQCIFVTFNITH